MSPIVIALLNPVAENPSLAENARPLELMSRTARNSFSASDCCRAHFPMCLKNFLPFPRLRARDQSTIRPRYGSLVVANPKDSSARPDSLSSRNRPNCRETFGSQFDGLSVKESLAFCSAGSRSSASCQ
jgi:hypothetical protein